MRVQLDGNSLSLNDVLTVSRGLASVSISPTARKKMARSRVWVEKAVSEHTVVYGVTTGFGAFQSVSIPPGKLKELQRNLILSHCVGVGEPFPDEVVRAMMLLRANALTKGYSGIRISTVELLLTILNKGVLPVVPSQGSVGASGDLAPLSHMAALLLGEGKARFKGKVMSGRAALRAAGVKPVELAAKEGLALNNGTQAMTAVGVLALLDAEILAGTADLVAAMTLEAVKGKSTPFAAEVHQTRPHTGQSVSAGIIRQAIKGSSLVDALDADTDGKVQDSYAIRCVPQVHGATRDALAYVRRVLETEINSATDNPLIFPDDDRALSGGNFHGEPVALVMDFLALAAAELGNISERRTAKLLDKHHNAGLPAFLAANGGIQSGLMMVQYTAAALVSENKVLIHPASGDSIPTSANQEDHVSMGTIAARQAAMVVLAIEVLVAATALRLRGGKPGKGTRAALRVLETLIKPSMKDRVLTEEIAGIAELIRAGELERLVH